MTNSGTPSFLVGTQDISVAPEANYEWSGYVLHVHVCIACHTGHKAASMLGLVACPKKIFKEI